jgi:hypothetical protein
MEAAMNNKKLRKALKAYPNGKEVRVIIDASKLRSILNSDRRLNYDDFPCLVVTEVGSYVDHDRTQDCITINVSYEDVY